MKPGRETCLHCATGRRTRIPRRPLVLVALFVLAFLSDEAVSAPTTGACCVRESVDPVAWSCQKTTAEECDAVCGVYHGDGSRCRQIDCSASPARTCVDRATRVDLAGQALEAEPFFTNYSAFRGHRQEVKAAVDPARFPEISGQSCDVYVVAARDDDEWQADDVLAGVDVREYCPETPDTPSGGAVTTCGTVDAGTERERCNCQFGVFSGSTIRDYTFRLAYDVQLPTSAEPCFSVNGSEKCIGVGAGYDVVLDCNRDGVLGEGDYVDGLGRGAGFYVTGANATLDHAAADYCVPIPGFENQRIHYPVDAGSLDPLPLVVISHGAGHRYDWYDYIGNRLASYGYLVMSHANDVGSRDDTVGEGKIQSASSTTLRHTDALLKLLDDPQCASTISSMSCSPSPDPALCDLAGFVDTSRIVWIGHSRGGEGVVRAYDRLYDCSPEYDPDAPGCDFTDPSGADPLPERLVADQIALVVSMAPTSFLADGRSEPHDVPYALIYGSADTDVDGAPAFQGSQPFQLYERATGRRQLFYIHGVGHAWLHDCEPANFNCADPKAFGPSLLGSSYTQQAVTSYLVALLDHYVRGGAAAVDYLWRPVDQFPPLTDTDIAGRLEYRNGLDPGALVVDNFQEEPSDLGISSAGFAVVHDFPGTPEDISYPFEGKMRDRDCTFEWDPFDSNHACSGGPAEPEPMNGMTRARDNDDAKCLVFGWDGAQRYGYDFGAPLDLSSYVYLSFRAAQTTRHPLNVEELQFSVELEDSAGTKRSLSTAAYGFGIGRPYQRMESGLVADPGIGWQNEFETVRIPIADFLTNGTGLNLGEIVRMSFVLSAACDAGAAVPCDSGSGRLAIDDVELTTETFRPQPPPCYTEQPCNGIGCLKGTEAIDLIDQGVDACRLQSGELFECEGGTVQLATYPCDEAACCTSTPACPCQVGGCPNGTYLECR